jgi:pimeloyl-ACP methyl ester carboxylesterase
MASTSAGIKDVVLVHGAWVDGSGWKGVYDLLKGAGCAISVVQNPTVSLADDAAVTRRAIAAHHGPVILVGHSYGGAVITEAGTDPRVAGLVYIAGWVPDRGEALADALRCTTAPILPPQDGFLLLDRAKFHSSFAQDVDGVTGTFLSDAQVPWGEGALTGTVTEPAWRSKPSWYLVTTEDRMIAPDTQRAMARRAGASVTEVAGSHAVFMSQPGAVASLIQNAAKSVAAN